MYPTSQPIGSRAHRIKLLAIQDAIAFIYIIDHLYQSIFKLDMWNMLNTSM